MFFNNYKEVFLITIKKLFNNYKEEKNFIFFINIFLKIFYT